MNKEVSNMFFENTEELAQNKLLLLYIINESRKPLTNNEITEFVLQNNYMNYFLIQQYLSELVDSEFLEYKNSKEKNVYILLDKGKYTLSYFKDRIPKDIQEEISNKFSEMEAKQMKAAQITGEYYKKHDREYMVNIKLVENSKTLLSLYLSVPTEKQAQKICDVWEEKTEYIYKNLLNMLVDDEITSIEY